MQNIFIFSLIYIIDHGQAKTSAAAVFLFINFVHNFCLQRLDLFTLRHSVCSFFCSGSLAVDPVDGALNYVIALLLPPIGTSKKKLSEKIYTKNAIKWIRTRVSRVTGGDTDPYTNEERVHGHFK
jgi:hypothetical protein